MEHQEPTWEYRELTISRDVSREAARQQLMGEADTGRWELDRLVRFADGRRLVRLRRRIYRVRRTA